MYTLLRKHRHQTKKSNLRSLADIGKSVSSASRLFSSQENGSVWYYAHSLVQPVHLQSCYFCHWNSSNNICSRFIHWKNCSSPFFLSFSSLFLYFFSLGLCRLWPLPSGTLIARNPLEHPVPCLTPQDSEEPCEVTRSCSMGHLCEWGRGDWKPLCRDPHVNLAAWKFWNLKTSWSQLLAQMRACVFPHHQKRKRQKYAKYFGSTEHAPAPSNKLHVALLLWKFWIGTIWCYLRNINLLIAISCFLFTHSVCLPFSHSILAKMISLWPLQSFFFLVLTLSQLFCR